MLRRIVFMVFITLGLSANAQDTISAMVYNLLEFPSAKPPNRESILKTILDEYKPDIFMVSELESEAGGNLILDIALSTNGNNYSMAPFEPSQSGDPDHQQLLFYRHDKFSLESWEVLPTTVRDINRYQLKLNTTDQQSDPVFIEAFVVHLKSSQGSANKLLRLQMVQKFVDRLETIDPNSFVLFAGDLNVYTASEPAYQKLLDPTNKIVMVDPINRPGSWHDNIAFQDIHSQSTRVSSGPFGAGAGGGLDDRFDFIIMSQNMKTDPKLKYVPDTYKSFGNNGNCFDKSINDPSCSGDHSQELRENLYNMSDHLPIVMKMSTNKEIILKTEVFALESPFILESTLVYDKLNILLKSNLSNPITFEIYNVLGQKLLEFVSENSLTVSLDISHVSTGVYYLRSNLPDSPTFKFLKTS
ncbi:MAG TPA: T9SS type A sorting domain-containing protein [Aequorivita sp.]|nr:T9SS type A sorting domain-containing protein [Aequorivita sp.]